MSLAELDELLGDLEHAMEQRRGGKMEEGSSCVRAAHLSSEGDCQKTPGAHCALSPPFGQPPARCSDSAATMSSGVETGNPIKQNINELDVLLQDLSSARFSEHVEKHSEIIATSQTYTETSTKVVPVDGSTNGFVDASKAKSSGHSSGQRTSVMKSPPPPPVRQFSASSSQQRHEAAVAFTSKNGVHASSATRELDDLMCSLDTFKLKEGAAEEAVSTTLDEMLGSLQENMEKHGVRTVQKGVCHACQKPIVGQVVTALAKTFHPEHFTCAECNQELGSRNFFEREGKAYCELDYHRMFSPRCAGCEGPILDKCITALGSTWHPEHFVCANSCCGRPFGEDGYHEREGKAYCRDCYYSAFAPKCGGCSLPITENYISSLDRTWHPSCFVCRTCGQPFVDGNFFEHDNQPYCELHYHEMRGAPCAGCGKPISGRCITAMFRKFHPEHFVCSFCLKQLNKGTFKENKDKPYCHGCYDRLFG